MAERFPVIDGDDGNGDLYGYAATKRGAKRVAGRYYADPVVDAYLANEAITLRDGTIVHGAWIATTFSVEGH